MTEGRTPRSAMPLRIAMITSSIVALAALIVSIDQLQASRAIMAAPAAPRVESAPLLPAIPEEAGVYRTRYINLAIDPTIKSWRPAHPRTLATFRSLRAYPGAPPSVPHGLTAEEFRNGGCNTCHERGGFSQRFGAYAPVAPHPELQPCLQCHAGTSELMDLPLPGADPDALCRQCHAAIASRRAAMTELNWRPAPWPALANVSELSGPPPIPHDLQMRTNCLTCHVGAGAVEELRTDHPERINCRQCHVVPLSEPGEADRQTLAAAGGRP